MRWTWSVVVVLGVGCGSSDVYDPQIDPAQFSSTVDNPFFPLVPGTVFEYDVLETDEYVTVTVTSDIETVVGVPCVVVHDVATVNDVVVEDTFDWYAQDADGNVWYFGEDTTAFDGPDSSKEGSWTTGVDGAKPGIVALASPAVGDHYRQEFLPGEAEDEAEVLDLDASIDVPFGSFTGCLETADFTALEPDVVEHKYYCPGLGQVAAETVSGGAEHEYLVAVTQP